MQYYDNNIGSLKQKQHMKEYLNSKKNNHDNHDDNKKKINHDNNKKKYFFEKNIINRFKNLLYYYSN